MIKVKLGYRKEVALIDDTDAWITQWNWNIAKSNGHIYATRRLPLNERRDGEISTLLMHRVLLNAPTGVKVDHQDGNGLNNRRYNLRLATTQENARNAVTPRNNTSGVTGVHWHTKQQRWVARITIDYKKVHLGSFIDFEDAVTARLAAEEHYFGEFAHNPSAP
jgi:hypothetical protein